ncbi:MAG: histidine--tRNA ligase [Cytophagales bacterium]
MTSPNLPAGFRDLSPKVFAERKHITTTLEKIFVRHGFSPLETPAVEHLSTLLGKYGSEGDRLIFKILNSGDFLASVEVPKGEGASRAFTREISKRGLRFDLTVPMGGYVARNRHKLQFPFKRYQIDRVWRADRPQKGRYREFYQGDIDIVGSSSCYHEATLLVIAAEVFNALGIDGVRLHLNDRRILQTLNTQMQMGASEVFFYQTLDKIDHIGQEAAFELLAKHGYQPKALDKLGTLITSCDNSAQKLNTLHRYYEEENLSTKPLESIAKILAYVRSFSEKAYQSIKIDLQLARGMDYYTGAIFEMKLPESSLGSFGGGGRYDHLMEVFDQPSLPSTGISFGIDRIHDYLKTMGRLPSDTQGKLLVLLAPMESAIEHDAIQYLKQLHAANIAAELYPAGKRMKHILSYAHKKNIPWVVIIGNEEIANNQITMKNMETGMQKKCNFAELMALLKESAFTTQPL